MNLDCHIQLIPEVGIPVHDVIGEPRMDSAMTYIASNELSI